MELREYSVSKLARAARSGPFADFYDTWMPIGVPSDVGRKRPVAMQRMGLELVLWRDEKGRLRCADQYCPHRRVSLGTARVCGGQLECALHGFRFDGAGRCTLAPCEGVGARLPRALTMETFEVREQYDFIWLWFGERRSVYPPLPWFPAANDERFHSDTVTHTWPVSFDRAMENCLDLAHFPVLHRRALPQAGDRLTIHEATLAGPLISLTFSYASQDGGRKQPEPFKMEMLYPSLATANVLPKAFYVIGTTPIDESNVWFFSRVYQRYLTIPLLGPLLSRLMLVYEHFFVLPDDLRVVRSQANRSRGLSEVFVPSDVGITMWYQQRRKARAELNAAYEENERAPTELNGVPEIKGSEAAYNSEEQQTRWPEPSCN